MPSTPPDDGHGTRESVLRELQRSDVELTVAQIASQLGVHPNTVRFHLDALTARGLVQRVAAAPDGPGRPAVRVKAIAGMDPDGPRRYRALAEALVDTLSDAADGAELARRAGGRWAQRLLDEHPPPTDADPESVLMRMLETGGFTPESNGRDAIWLRNCPFLELVGSTADLVCGVHLGLMRGTLDALDADRDVDRLEPFVEPGLCVAHLTERREYRQARASSSLP